MFQFRTLRALKRTYKSIQFNHKRYFLSPAYHCEEAWNQRLKDFHIQNIKSMDFYYELLNKYRRENKLSAIDADLFFNSLTKENYEDLMQETDECLSILRSTPETINTFPSSIHAVMRLIIEAGRYEDVLRFLSNPIKYGVFLDIYLANLLMDTLLKEENYTGAARIASNLMLQEDFGSPLTKALALLSCVKFALHGEGSHPWIDHNPIIEPEEEVKIVVPYIRNPYFDEHFDLKTPTHVTGKTLAWFSMLLDEPFKSNAAFIGWALFEKWNNLSSHLEDLLMKKNKLDTKLLELVESNLEKCELEDIKEKIVSLITQIKESDLLQEMNFEEKIAEQVIKCAQEEEAGIIKDQETLYKDWVIKRDEAVQVQLASFEKVRLLKEIEEKKKYLEEKEELLFFFENKDKIELRFPKETAEISEEEAEKKKIQEEYVVPEI